MRSMILLLQGSHDANSELGPEGPVQHRREERAQLLRRPDLVLLEPVNLGLELVEAGDDAALFIDGRGWNLKNPLIVEPMIL